jgi:hypothetical protein
MQRGREKSEARMRKKSETRIARRKAGNPNDEIRNPNQTARGKRQIRRTAMTGRAGAVAFLRISDLVFDLGFGFRVCLVAR